MNAEVDHKLGQTKIWHQSGKHLFSSFRAEMALEGLMTEEEASAEAGAISRRIRGRLNPLQARA